MTSNSGKCTVSSMDTSCVRDDSFETFYEVTSSIARVNAYNEKTAIINNFFTKGKNGNTFQGDLLLWCSLLCPQINKKVYNLKSKQLIKLFSKIFECDQSNMKIFLEEEDVAETIESFFKQSARATPAKHSNLSIQQVSEFLEKLSTITKEEEQIEHFMSIIPKCTTFDLKMLIRLITGDLRINAGTKHILEGVHPDAYTMFQTSRDLAMVLAKVTTKRFTNNIKAELSLMTPVLPMLAEACKSIEIAMKKCPNGIFSEIKYDGERVQVHKQNNNYKYFSRSLKPVMAHKINHCKEYIPRAFPTGCDMILDAEILLVDNATGKPLPFGTLGVHKKSQFQNASVCLYVFDCLYYNGEVLLNVPIKIRRKILEDNIIEIPNRVMLSEQQLMNKPSDLAKMISKVLQQGLEGLILKDIDSIYAPGKRHWLKVKKDYLFDGAMADTTDLVVLGAYFGTGKKKGMMSIFLMGCFHTEHNIWYTVTKVHTGHTDSSLARVQNELMPNMHKISKDANKLPKWIVCHNSLVPDFIAIDPKKQPVWEITGTEFTKSPTHTASGISIRFPRITKIRDDKNWETATSYEELRDLYKKSTNNVVDVSMLNNLIDIDGNEPPVKKTKM